ncbi:Gfo/Idh/MocA family protein [Actinokineospora pegani]|uniref:Gfo/Idh/MocA family protein n=1 Tax=Actinokineospora pegani TaxID=2654637 RepID=UPI0012E9A995|nr:Gfo/Idh/MocA family oxidoreductase [Actinokineospora pegani]
MSVRVAVVGLGWAGRELWLSLLREHPDFEVVAVVDADPAARAAFADEPGTAVHASVAELTAAAVDLAVVAVPNHLHASVAAALLSEQIPVFMEKPVCLSTAEADLLDAAERGGAVLLAGSAARHRGDIAALGGLIPELGGVRHVCLGWVRSRGVPRSGWFTQRDKAGGGVLFDLGWHLFDALASLLGPVPFAQVVGSTTDDFVNLGSWGATWRQDRAAGDTADVEDTARGFLVREDGVSVSLLTSWASHEPLDLSLVRVEGSTGVAELRCTFGFSPNRSEPVLTLTREGASTRVELPAEPIGAEYRRQLDGLAALLADPGNRGRAIAEARTNVATIESFYASARASVRPASPAYQ